MDCVPKKNDKLNACWLVCQENEREIVTEKLYIREFFIE